MDVSDAGIFETRLARQLVLHNGNTTPPRETTEDAEARMYAPRRGCQFSLNAVRVHVSVRDATVARERTSNKPERPSTLLCRARRSERRAVSDDKGSCR